MLTHFVCVVAAIYCVESVAGSALKLSLLVPDFDATKVTGTAGKDYPAFRDIPHTNFRCDSSPPGIYADRDTRCQVFHMCDTDTLRFTFMCPNGTIFDEKKLKCNWWQKVTCKKPVNLMFPTVGTKGKALPAGGQPMAQDRTFDLVDNIADLIKYARRRNQDDDDTSSSSGNDEGGSRFREIMRRVLRILTTGL